MITVEIALHGGCEDALAYIFCFLHCTLILLFFRSGRGSVRNQLSFFCELLTFLKIFDPYGISMPEHYLLTLCFFYVFRSWSELNMI